MEEFEMAPRVECIEQQLEQLPVKWKQFAGKPMQITYYDKAVNTFRENPSLMRPSASFTAWAVKELRQEMGDDGRRLSDKELESVVCQEWRTDLTRSLLETRLNRHGSRDGPVVRRSPSGVIYAAPQPSSRNNGANTSAMDTATSSKFVLDAIATPGPRKKPVMPK